MRIKKPLVIIIIVIAVGSIGWMLLKKKTSSQDTVKIVNPNYGDIQTVITTTATVFPENRLEVKPPVNGRVEKILVQEGDMVKAGQVLAWMSSTDRAALLDSARGQGEQEYKYWQDVYKPIALVAPIDGQVIVATTQPGQTMTTSDAVIVLSDHLIVRAQVDETDIGRVKLHQAAFVSLDAYPDTKIKAVVAHIYYESKTVNNVTIYEVDLLPQQVPSFFRSGMNTNVDFIVQSKSHILLLPVAAVHKKADQSFVLLAGSNPSKPTKQEVETGISDDKNIEIVSGLKEDDEVVMHTKKYNLNKAGTTGSNPFMPSRPAGNKPSGGGRPGG